ncbi:hypothetical protein SISSUDRAFT_1130476 [Sistotremastrum suecicum HHB10207 ss-3]|uniref:Uncharacterized protein n=1 Tax=Sistotremastrum suecicum HHB10207 ss-3 TaxID=1314776 RepID=A0A166BDV8_9AGAM|nr:hypothetical protein SISSUDRAFT_1130476 [Sistotremastrum suecicum HHB10207 ss-3]
MSIENGNYKLQNFSSKFFLSSAGKKNRTPNLEATVSTTQTWALTNVSGDHYILNPLDQSESPSFVDYSMFLSLKVPASSTAPATPSVVCSDVYSELTITKTKVIEPSGAPVVRINALFEKQFLQADNSVTAKPQLKEASAIANDDYLWILVRVPSA